MKKSYVILVLLLALSLTSCSSNEAEKAPKMEDNKAQTEVTTQTESNTSEESTTDMFTEEDGKLVSLDKESNILEVPALKTIINKEEKIIEIYPADENGEVSDDYYKFDFNSNTYEKYSFVTQMGKGYYYTGDLNTGELLKVEDMDNNDSTESMKQNGRYEKAAEKTKNEVEELKSYFETKYKMTMEDAIK